MLPLQYVLAPASIVSNPLPSAALCARTILMSPHTTRSRGCSHCVMLGGRNMRMNPYCSINFLSSSALCTDALSQNTLSGERIRGRPRRLLLQPPRRQDSLNVHGKPPCIHPRLGTPAAGDARGRSASRPAAGHRGVAFSARRKHSAMLPMCDRSWSVGWKIFGLPGSA